MKKLLVLTMMVVLAVMCTFAVSAETTDFTFWSKEPYTENETTKIYKHTKIGRAHV